MEKFQKDSTYALISAAQNGDADAKEKLVSENMGLVLYLSKKFYNRGYEADDINQLGAMGLVRAIDNFNLSLDVKFSTYAVPMILGEIRRFLRDDGPIKVSRTIKQTASLISRFVEEEQKTKGKTPGVLEIAQALKMSAEDIVAAKEATTPPESIFFEREDCKKNLSDFLKSNIDESKILTEIDIRRAISSLCERERKIIVMRYFEDKTQSVVSKKLGISQVQVSRLEKKILEKLKKMLVCEN